MSAQQRGVIYDRSAKSGMRMAQIAMPDADTMPSNKVLVKIKAVGINPVDFKIPDIPVMGIMSPKKTVGLEFSGVVQKVGKDVKGGLEGRGFKAGDKVFGMTAPLAGCMCDFFLADPSKLWHMPKAADFAQAACMPVVALTSLQALRNNGLKEGDKVLILGASGGCGSAGVQIAKALGAHVTGVCSGKNVDLVTRLGADRVIDYTQRTVSEALAGEAGTFDVVYDTVKSSAAYDKDYEPEARPLLKKDGRYVAINGSSADLLRYFFSNATGINVQRKGFKLLMTDQNAKDLRVVAEMMDDGKFSSVLDLTLDLTEDTLHAGFDRLKSRRTVGKIVMMLDKEE